MGLCFSTWLHQMNEVSSFWGSLFKKPDAGNVTRDFINFIKDEFHILVNAHDPKFMKQLESIVKSFLTGTATLPKPWLEVTHAINGINKQHLTPHQVAGMYVEAHNAQPKKFPYANNSNEPPYIIPLNIDQEWSNFNVTNTATNMQHLLGNDEFNRMKPILGHFKATSGYNTKTPREDIQLATFIHILNKGLDAPWKSMFKRIYDNYSKNSHRPTSAVEFIENLVHSYHIKNYKEVLDFAEEIDEGIASKGSGPPGPPPGPSPSPTMLTPAEAAILEHGVNTFPKSKIDSSAPKGTMLTLADWRAIKAGSAEYNSVMRHVHAKYSRWEDKQKFINADKKIH